MVDLSRRQKVDEKLIPGIFKAMISQADSDDDREMMCIVEAIERIQLSAVEEPERAFDIAVESGISFTELRYYHGHPTNFRDHILEKPFQIKLVDRMSRLGIDLNEPLIEGQTPVCTAASQRRLNEQCEADLAGAIAYFSRESMEARNVQGTSAVHEAVRNNHYKMLQAMIGAGIDVNLTEDRPKTAGFTLLHKACRYGYPDIVRLLLDAGADDTMLDAEEESPAHIVLFHNYVTGSKRLGTEERIELVRALKHIDVPGKNGRTPLMAALSCGDYNIARALAPVFIEKGADVNHRDNFGNTPLLLDGDIDVVKALVKAGADVNARNSEGDTPLHRALETGSRQIAVYLIKKGADIHAVDKAQITPVQLAAEKGFDELLPLMGL
ncbi:MAG: ankyrin repeat domain-containing protein [Lachnospiraceae bacterium]|nr:ankyrin repeat domain-containing protein [Lachnospiraceae bacterium]